MSNSGEHSQVHSHQEVSDGQDWFSQYKEHIAIGVSLILLLTGIILRPQSWFTSPIELIWFSVAYAPVGIPVLLMALKRIRRGDVFHEFFLMSLATIGAFAIGEYPEGVAVMLFYAIGELVQHAAVHNAKRNIQSLLDIRPHTAIVLRDGNYNTVDPSDVAIGETIQVLSGARVPLDGVLVSAHSSFNTAALTGESVPRSIDAGGSVLAGMVNLTDVITMEVTKRFEDSSLARILDLVRNATKRKAKTERFIYRFARVYTPIVVGLAALLVVVPFFLFEDYAFETWLYRALVFLVISCPCALVISIPLGYFGGIGAASRNGILFKGSNYLDRMMRVNTVAIDKTGTLTKGVFAVQEVQNTDAHPERFIEIVASLERLSTHPIARAIVAYAGSSESQPVVTGVEEIPGHGIKGTVDGQTVLAGNLKLLDKFNIAYSADLHQIEDAIVTVAIDGQYKGYITLADELKANAASAVKKLRANGVSNVVMLSGDRDRVTQRVATTLGIDKAYGDLLPEQKVEILEQLKSDSSRVVAFAGDGINDAPALALADVGIAMGGLGSDLAIETADVVIQTDEPTKISQAIRISRATNRIVWQNISMAFGVKALVLILGAGGMAGMWEAVFADVGVALLAILNAVRIQRMNFHES